MKINRTLTIGVIAGLTTACLPALSFANDGEQKADKTSENLEKPEDSTDKPASAWVGVYSVPLPKLVSEHVGLEEGQGVMIEAVLAGSPAEKAGLMKKDILTHVDSKVIEGGKSLSKLVASKKPGEQIVLNIRRKNESKQVQVDLEPKPEKMALSGQKPEPRDDYPLVGTAADQRFEQMMQQMEEDFRRGFDQALEDHMGGVARMRITPGNGVHQRMEVVVADQDGRMSVTTNNGNTTVKLWDKEDELLFEGPYNTEEEKNAVPEELRKRLDRVKAENPTMLWVSEGFRNHDDQVVEADPGEKE